MSAAEISISFGLNGHETQARVSLKTSVFDLLREHFELTSIRSACDGIGLCGACTVRIDGRASPACLMLAVDLAGARVETAEGLAGDDDLHPLQQAFMAYGALQCGYCTSGMLMSAAALLDENPHPSRNEIQRTMTGNLCRCTGYSKIIEAIEAVARGEFS